MTPAAATAVAFVVALGPGTDLPTRFWGITPDVPEKDVPKLKRKADAAVVLIHGLMPRPLRPGLAEQADPHGWQKPGADLVKALAADADVYGFSYAQTGPVDSVVLSRGLQDGIAAVKAAGYKELVLVGHSAGGIVARRFVELFPDAGVTKVVSVAAPHLGSDWASLPDFTLPKTQHRFIHSMTPDRRATQAKEWGCVACKTVQFGVVICKLPRIDGDGVVSVRSQWPDALQDQGVPAVLVGCSHFDAMKCEKGVKAVTELVQGKVVRWEPAQVGQARKVLFGEEKKEKR